jgi:hypothetical protein
MNYLIVIGLIPLYGYTSNNIDKKISKQKEIVVLITSSVYQKKMGIENPYLIMKCRLSEHCLKTIT